MTSTGEKVYHAMCNTLDPMFLKQVMDQNPDMEQRGLFGWSGMQMDGVCELRKEFLKQLFKISKQIVPADLKHALVRLDNFHANRLLRSAPNGWRTLRQEAQGITNMMSHVVNRKRRNSVDCSRLPAWMEELVQQSSGSPSRPEPSTAPAPCKKASMISDKGDLSKESILAAFGFDESQIVAIDGDNIVEVSSEDGQPGKGATCSSNPTAGAASSSKPWTDFSEWKAVRMQADGTLEEHVDLFQKDSEPFYFAAFADGTEYLTELPVGTKDPPPVNKKPKAKAKPKKAAMKKPASKNQSPKKKPASKVQPEAEAPDPLADVEAKTSAEVEIDEPKAKSKPKAVAKKKSEKKSEKPSLSCTVNSKWSIMYYKFPKNAYGIREKGKSRLFQILCRDKDPLTVRSQIVHLGIPKLESGTDPTEVKELLLKSVHKA
ncbi:unnamed protein product [Symbiodinium sp. CCMP2592]|nr:unnamed protein product [Symbiodinium sp. CCMP2592]CAE7459906.1 unnamed protein product [Symbiodinium sp. CCMP2592]